MLMYNSIILSSCLFGSFYIFTKSFELINQSIMENKKIQYELIVINGLTFMMSGSIFLYGFYSLNFSRL